MRARDWLYFGLITAGLGFLTLFLSAGVSFAFRGVINPDFDFFLITLAPLLVSLPLAYAIFARRFQSPLQHRLLKGILLNLLGVVMFLSGIGAYGSSFGFWNPIDPFVEILISLLGLQVMVEGFRLTLRIGREKVVKPDGSTPQGQVPAIEREGSAYLPAAGIAMLIATLLTFMIMFLSVPTALSGCYGNTSLCPPPAMFFIGVLSTLGFITGIGATSKLLRGDYHRIVPLGVTLQVITAIFTLITWTYWILLALPLVVLCAVSIIFTAWNQWKSWGRREWKHVGLVSGSLGASALVAGLSLFAYEPCNACLNACSRPYATDAGLLATLGAAGITLALMSVDSLRSNRGRPRGFRPAEPRQVNRSKFSRIMVFLFGLNLALAAGFSMLLVAPHLTQCQGFCYTRIEQLQITQVIFGPAANQVTFTLQNSGTSDVTVTQVQVQGGGYVNPTDATQISTPLICSGGTMLMVATFQGVNFVSGTTYDFVLISTQGNKFPYAATK